MYEYYLKCWGQAEDRVKEGLRDLYNEDGYFFIHKEHRDNFKKMIKAYAGDQIIVFAEYEGEDVRLHTVVSVDATFKGRHYTFEYDYGPGYPVEAAEYMFEDGNYSCNCNLSRFIQDKYPDFPELDCMGDEEGNEIEYAFIVEQRRVD